MSKLNHTPETENETTVLTGEVLSKTEETHINKAIAELNKEAVIKVNKVDVGIQQLHEQYGNLTINGLADRPGYMAAVDGYKLVKKVRTGIEAKRKALKAFPIALGKAIDAEAKRITELVKPLEDRLGLEVKKYEDAEAAHKQAEAQRKREALLAAGFRFDGNFYICGIHAVDASSLADLPDDKLAYYVAEAEQIQAAEKAAEERRQAEQTRLNEMAQQLEQERAAIRKERVNMRVEKLGLLGLKMHNNTLYVVHSEQARTPICTVFQLGEMSPADFDAVVERARQVIKQGYGEGENAETLQSTGPVTNASTFKPENEAAPEFHHHSPSAEMFGHIDEVMESGHSAEYIDGYEHCREAVLTILNDKSITKRVDILDRIQALKP